MRRALIVGVAVAVLAWLGWLVTRRLTAPTASVPAPADSTGSGVKSVRLYFAAPNADSLVGESRELVEAGSLHERVTALVAELDRGPRGGGVAALPAGTAVLHVYLNDRGLMTLDLSGAFRRGFRGGSSAEYLAIASLLRTIGANEPDVRRVRLVCAGRPLSTLGGHLPLDQPLDVADWL